MPHLLLPWSDTDQALLTHYAAGMERVHKRFVDNALASVSNHPIFRDTLKTMTPADFQAHLSGHLSTLLADPRKPETRSRGANVGWAHIHAGIPPSWYLVLYNTYFKSYHDEQALNAADLPPLPLVRRRWVLDVADTLDAYDQNTRSTLDAMTYRVQDLESFAYRDPLTGIANRRAVEDAIEHYVEEPGAQLAALVLVDLDELKVVNDTHGHPAGDEVLRQFATSLTAAIRSTDLLGRIGGDEFCLWLRNRDDGPDVVSEVQQILKTIGGYHGGIGCSAGISWYPKDGQKFRDLYFEADVALYSAKRQGKGCLVVSGSPSSIPLY